MRIGFIGLGTMGLPMAANLRKGGHDVTGHDANAAARGAAEDAGLSWVDSITEASQDVDVIITMLPNGAVVKTVALGPGGIADTMRRDSLYIDMSTISSEETDELTTAFTDRGLAKIDAPVARSSKEAIEGKLLIMVGGSESDVARAQPLFDLMGDSVMHCGPAGSGTRMKLVNNFMSLTINVVTAEALAMGQRAGMPLEVLYRVMSQTVAGKGHLTTTYPQKAFQGDLEPGFMIDLARKDLDLIIGMSDRVGLPAATARAALTVYEQASRNGRGRQDHTAIYDMCLKGGPWQ